MRLFYLSYREQISQTPSGKLPQAVFREIFQTLSAESSIHTPRFPLPWSHYVRLLSVENREARALYGLPDWLIRAIGFHMESI